MGNIKQINSKNDVINIEELDSNSLKIDKKLYKIIDITLDTSQ